MCTPHLNIELTHVVVDELHLLMRICDVLLRNLIEDSVNLDHKNKIGKRGQTNQCLDELVSCVRSCGVSFSIWENKVKDGRGDFLRNLKWSSLTGSDFKKVLDNLPQKLTTSSCLHSTSKSTVVEIWEDFKNLYKIMNAWSPPQIEIDIFFKNAKSFILKFLSLGKYLEGYDSSSITPYMHIMVYHVPKMLKTFGSIKQFTGQGVEKSNDDIKLIYHRGTNKHSAIAEALRVRRRKYLLKQRARIKRKYNKLNLRVLGWWWKEINSCKIKAFILSYY